MAKGNSKSVEQVQTAALPAEQLPEINRYAVVLVPTEEFIKWLGQAGDLSRESVVYLIPEIESELEGWLQKNYMTLFEHELFGWCADSSQWPKDLSYTSFRKLFEARFASMVLDLAAGRIEKEEW